VLLEWLPHHPVDTVMLAGRWDEEDLPYLQATIASVQPYARRVVVVGPVPQYISSLPRLLVRALQKNDPKLCVAGIGARRDCLGCAIAEFGRRTSAHTFDDSRAVQGDQCRTMAAAGVPMHSITDTYRRRLGRRRRHAIAMAQRPPVRPAMF